MSQKVNDTMIISRGSTDNVDPAGGVVSSGQSQIKAFDLSKVPLGEYHFQISTLLIDPKLGLGDIFAKHIHPDDYLTTQSCPQD